MTRIQYVLRLGARGGFLASVGNAWDILDIRPPFFVYKTSPNEEVQDHFITFDVAIADLRDGAVRASYHYEPDYDANNALVSSTNEFAGQGEGPVRVEGDYVYLTIFGRKIYRYRLADAAPQRPLLVASGVQFLGGPYRGWLYASRPDGVWALRPEAKTIRARLVVASEVKASHISIAGDVVYATFEDGRVVGVDATSGRRVFESRPCGDSGMESGIRAAADRVYIVCQNDLLWRVAAFQNPR